MYESLQNLKGTSSPWASTKLFRCTFHFFYQVWNKKLAGKEKDDSEKAVIASVNKWFVHMIYSVQYEYQLDDAMKEFEHKLVENKDLLPNTYLNIHKLWYGMKGYRVKWARCYKRNTRDLEVTATSISESFNASLKQRCGKKKLPSSNFEVATSKVMNHSDYLCDKREFSLARSIQCHTGKPRVSETSKYLTEYAEDKATEIFARCIQYDVLQYTETKWLVSHKSNRPCHTAKKNIGSIHDPFSKDPLNNTHHVNLCKKTNKFWCSCNGAVRIGMPCPHIGAVAKRKHPSMFNVRWYKIYCSLTYSKDPAVMTAFNDLSAQQMKTRGGVDATACLKDMAKFHEICLPDVENPYLVAKQMTLAYCMHLKECTVKKNMTLDWDCMQDVNDPTLLSLRNFISQGVGEPIVTEEVCEQTQSFDSDDHLIGETPKQVTMSQDINRYNKMIEHTKRICKLCEGRDDVYTKMLSMMNEMEEAAMKIIAESDTVVQDEMNRNSTSSIVSSNAPIECTPNRGRFKSAYETR